MFISKSLLGWPLTLIHLGLRETAKLNVETNPEWAAQVLAFCVEKLEPVVNTKFTLVLDDPSGYSTIENLHLPYPDPKIEIRHYGRTREQDEKLGIQVGWKLAVLDFRGFLEL